MIRIVFDNIIFKLQNSGGGSVYWKEITTRAYHNSDLLCIFSEPISNDNNIYRKALDYQPSMTEKLPLALLRLISFTIPIKEKSIFHSSYYRISNSKHAINVVTIHDFTSEFYFKGLRRIIHKYRKKRAILKSDGIICISNNTKNDLLKLYPEVHEKKISVIYNGVSDEYYELCNESRDCILKRYKLNPNYKYIIFIGHRTSYKNFNVAIDTISSLPQEFNLLIIGERLNSAEKQELDKKLKNRYYIFSKLNNSQVNELYNIAYCLLYPSSYEGFGIPIIEAMKSGCPVVSTNCSSIPEVAEDCAILVDQINVSSFTNAILKLEGSELRKRLIMLGKKQAQNFSWEKCFNEVVKLYRKLYE